MRPENFEMARQLLKKVEEIDKVLSLLKTNDVVCIKNIHTLSFFQLSAENEKIAIDSICSAFLIKKEFIENELGKLD